MHSAATSPVVCAPRARDRDPAVPSLPLAAHKARKDTEERDPTRSGSDHGHWVPIRRAGEEDLWPRDECPGPSRMPPTGPSYALSSNTAFPIFS